MELEILNQARVAYFLGNYQKVLDVWQSNTSGEDDEYFNFTVARALMAQRELKPNSQFQIQKKPSQQLLEITELVSKFMSPLLKAGRPNSSLEDDRKIIEEALKKIKESFDDNTKYSRILKIICGYLSINACEAQYALSLESSEKDAASNEIKFLQLLCFLRGNRPELAEKKLNELKKFDDEDILTYLGQIYTYIYNGQPTDTLRAINEAKDRFGESAKLMNLMVSALIGQNKFEEAFQLAQLLQQALLEKEQFSDRVEIETCLSNLIVLAEICGKQSVREECQLALQTINQGSLLLKIHNQKLQQMLQEFQ